MKFLTQFASFKFLGITPLSQVEAIAAFNISYGTMKLENDDAWFATNDLFRFKTVIYKLPFFRLDCQPLSINHMAISITWMKMFKSLLIYSGIPCVNTVFTCILWHRIPSPNEVQTFDAGISFPPEKHIKPNCGDYNSHKCVTVLIHIIQCCEF